MNLTKRIFDIVVSGIALIFAFPLLAILFLICKIGDSGPFLYWSKRVGVHSTIFLMPKIRTMKLNTPQVATHLLTNSEDYLTPMGRFLRKSSLDELPQLMTIFKGDMSFVGPRPALFNQDDLMELRRSVGVDRLVPGLTGWAQINGRDEISIPDKVALEKTYMEQQSFILDLKIIFWTFFKVLKQESIKH
jgi:O-antigen biosynthesis protein WbqP